ncbi:hypothetical protein C8R46DRAFT_1137979 [Mycena filopes]|nr:hypothetical protein C8R46DRAFT_1137979 [Mycena filopes]
MATQYGFLPLPQDAIRDPEKWNSDWEVLLRGPLALPLGPARAFDTKLAEIGRKPSGLDDALFAIQSLEALKHFNDDDFDAKWLDAGTDARRKHILGAMADVCSKARNLNDARMYCVPELRLTRLRLDGKAFLDLLKSVMRDDASFIPSQPVYVSHPGWDTWAAGQSNANDNEAMKAALVEISILRTKLICHVVHFTMRSFFGKEPPDFFVSKTGKSKRNGKPPPDIMAGMVQAFGVEGAKARVADENAGSRLRLSQRLAHCSYMGCLNTESEDGSIKFSRCKKCFETLQRRVVYCPRACQAADWKLRHKAMCGKPIDFETASQVVEHPFSVASSESRIGAPVGGYTRTVALVSQVTRLNGEPTVDYFVQNDEGAATTINFGANSYLQALFRDRRDRAMTTGNLFCVGALAHYLCAVFLSMKPEDRDGVTSNSIVAQFEREFDVDVRDLVLSAQQVQNRDPLHRPCGSFFPPPSH